MAASIKSSKNSQQMAASIKSFKNSKCLSRSAGHSTDDNSVLSTVA